METVMKTMTLTPFSLIGDPRSQLQELVDRLIRALGTVETWRLRHQRRMQFARVDARTLRDAGISEAQRFLVVNKPFWEA